MRIQYQRCHRNNGLIRLCRGRVIVIWKKISQDRYTIYICGRANICTIRVIGLGDRKTRFPFVRIREI